MINDTYRFGTDVHGQLFLKAIVQKAGVLAAGIGRTAAEAVVELDIMPINRGASDADGVSSVRKPFALQLHSFTYDRCRITAVSRNGEVENDNVGIGMLLVKAAHRFLIAVVINYVVVGEKADIGRCIDQREISVFSNSARLGRYHFCGMPVEVQFFIRGTVALIGENRIRLDIHFIDKRKVALMHRST